MRSSMAVTPGNLLGLVENHQKREEGARWFCCYRLLYLFLSYDTLFTITTKKRYISYNVQRSARSISLQMLYRYPHFDFLGYNCYFPPGLCCLRITFHWVMNHSPIVRISHQRFILLHLFYSPNTHLHIHAHTYLSITHSRISSFFCAFYCND